MRSTLQILMPAILLALVPSACGDGNKPLGLKEAERKAAARIHPAGEDVREPVEVKPVPEFSFTERSGKTVTLVDLKGKVWTAAFFFTRCKTICIPMNMEMKDLQDEFRGEPDFLITATSVDPDYDTPEVLQAHAKRYQALPDRWWFLTGPIDDVRAFAHEGLKIQWHPDDPLIHSPYFVLVDRAGVIRGYYNQNDADAMDRLRTDIRWLLEHEDPA